MKMKKSTTMSSKHHNSTRWLLSCIGTSLIYMVKEHRKSSQLERARLCSLLYWPVITPWKPSRISFKPFITLQRALTLLDDNRTTDTPIVLVANQRKHLTSSKEPSLCVSFSCSRNPWLQIPLNYTKYNLQATAPKLRLVITPGINHTI